MGSTQGIELGLARLADLAPKGFALGLHIRFTSAHLMFQTYSARWTRHYMSSGYALCDPVISWGLGNEGCARWSALDYPDPHDIFGQAARFGLNYGVAVAHGPVASRSIGGFARADREFSDLEMRRIAKVVAQLHAASTPPDAITPAQRHAMRLVAKGSRHSEAAALLCISESALKARLKAARARLSARTTTEAIQKARELNLL